MDAFSTNEFLSAAATIHTQSNLSSTSGATTTIIIEKDNIATHRTLYHPASKANNVVGVVTLRLTVLAASGGRLFAFQNEFRSVQILAHAT